MRSTRYTTEEFIAAAQKRHGDRYDYTKTVYVRSADRVLVTCREHGDFRVFAGDHHNNGAGCQKCANIKRGQTFQKTTEDFISGSKAVYGPHRFGYSDTDYVNSRTKVTIHCGVAGHGDFEATPDNHLGDKRGCPKCHIEKLQRRRTERKEAEFIAKSLAAHKDITYGYGAIGFTGPKNPVNIWCPKHRVFFSQMARTHASGQKGCRQCKSEDSVTLWAEKPSIAKSKVPGRLTKSQFVARSLDAHSGGDVIYGYGAVEYRGMNNHVDIWCPKHRVYFSQNASNHSAGQIGCPECTVPSHGEREIAAALKREGILYSSQHKFDGLKHLLSLKCDFYIPGEFNAVIEYNGEQHYRPVDFFGGVIGYIRTRHRDSLKKSFCVDNGIAFIEIPYTVEAPGSYALEQLRMIA